MSSRRRVTGKRTDRRRALDQIKRMRNDEMRSDEEELKSNRPIDAYRVDDQDVYQNVTEEEYKELVRKRREEAPFVEDDEGGMGYYDDGEEQFFDVDPDEDETFDEVKESGKAKGSGALSSAYTRRAKRMQRAKLGKDDAGGGGDSSNNKNKISNMFFSRSSTANKMATPSSSSLGGGPTTSKLPQHHNKRKVQDIDLDSMLDDLTSNPTKMTASRSSFVNKRSLPSKRKLYRKNINPIQTFDNEKMEIEYNDGYEFNEQGGIDHPIQHDEKKQNGDEQSIPECSKVPNDLETKELQATAKLDTKSTSKPDTPAISKRELLFLKAQKSEVRASAATEKALHQVALPPKLESNEVIMSDLPSNEVADWWKVGVDPSEGPGNEVCAEADDSSLDISDSLNFFWIDAVEVKDRPGKLYLIGKVKSGDSYKSCCVVVNNLQRYLYVVPKIPAEKQTKYSTMIDMPEEERNDLWMAMHNELQRILIPSCISDRRDQQCFKTKLVERRYAFESDDFPRGKNIYLKLQYLAKYPVLPHNICTDGGKTFSKISGYSSSPLETFLIRHKMLGPGWLKLTNLTRKTKNVRNPMASYCNLEYEIQSPKDLSLLKDMPYSPDLSVMSISLKTYSNPHTLKHEVVAISCITETNINPDGGASQMAEKRKKKISHFTVIRNLETVGNNNAVLSKFPEPYMRAAFQNERFREKDAFRIELNERALLNYFLTRVQREDPDVVVGHNLHKYGLDVLLSRIDNYRMGGLWSKLTRLQRGRLQPLHQGEAWHEYNASSNGRIFIDTYVSARELLSSQPNYTLTSLVASQLQQHRTDIDMCETAKILASGPRNFVAFLRHTLDDAMFVLQLMHKLEVLPLSKQLSNLCGYLWSKTLQANKRAERIEYLLLHEFDRSNQKFLVPEKFVKDKNNSKGSKKKKRKKESSYAGGMVFAPKKGLYDNFVVLLDFMSLYPSIIREYNICFTTVDRKHSQNKGSLIKDEVEHENENEHDTKLDDVPNLPSSSCKEGILPGVIKRLLESRRAVKTEMKKCQDAEKLKKLDIRQLAIKLTANSMYGCLGFQFSRFYAKPLAALITATGRETLQRAKSVAEQECGYDVIYGDTDSIMVDSRSLKLDEAKRIGKEIQQACNKKFKLLELEVDYVFQSILLLNKKKYAALVVKENSATGETKVIKEVKGLDMVRRDWCKLSKDIGNHVLDLILSRNVSKDEIVEQIHEFLTAQAQTIRTSSGFDNIDSFVITKSLNKQPEQYPDKSKQFHVQVALALKLQGKPVGVGVHIPYVICKEIDEQNGSQRKAYHPDEVRKAQGKLNIDIEWYLESQVHPPVNRLCAHIEGTSSPQLAHCLGLDTSKFSHSVMANPVDDDEMDVIPSVLQDDVDRFRSCKPLTVKCRECNESNPFPGVFCLSATTCQYESGLLCVNPTCQSEFWGFKQEGIYGAIGDDLLALLANRLCLSIRECTKSYYEGWTICTDPTCKSKTQKQSIRLEKGNSCLVQGCRGTVIPAYSDLALYTQLKYFQSLFDISRAQKRLESEKARQKSQDANKVSSVIIPSLHPRHKEIFNSLFKQMEQTVKHNNYNWVSPSIWCTLFQRSN